MRPAANRPVRAVRLAGWLLVGLGLPLLAALTLAVIHLTRARHMPWPDESAAHIERFRSEMTSLEGVRVLLFALLAGASLAVGRALLRKSGLGPRLALFGLNALLIVAWAVIEVLAIGRLDDSDAIYGMIQSSGLPTGIGYTGIACAFVLLIVDILALTNPSGDESVVP